MRTLLKIVLVFALVSAFVLAVSAQESRRALSKPNPPLPGDRTEDEPRWSGEGRNRYWAGRKSERDKRCGRSPYFGGRHIGSPQGMEV